MKAAPNKVTSSIRFYSLGSTISREPPAGLSSEVEPFFIYRNPLSGRSSVDFWVLGGIIGLENPKKRGKNMEENKKTEVQELCEKLLMDRAKPAREAALRHAARGCGLDRDRRKGGWLYRVRPHEEVQRRRQGVL